MKVTDEDLYEGFTREEIARYEQEVRKKHDPKIVDESFRRVRKMSKAQWRALKKEGEEVTHALAAVMGKAPEDPQVQTLIARHQATIAQFYPLSADMYQSLGQLYVEDEAFRAHYDKYRPGLADFMQKAMAYYAAHSMAA